MLSTPRILSGNTWEQALFTFDENEIRTVAKKYGVTMPTENKLFWFTVAGAVMRSKAATDFDKACAMHIIEEVHSELLKRAYKQKD